MSSPIKRQNHRIHPCNSARKNELLAHLLTQYSGKNILVVTAGDPALIPLSETHSTAVLDDASLAREPERTCDVLISYDLPEKAIVYMSRFARGREYALILLDAEEQKRLYGIETLLGRTIVQEPVTGFEPDFGIAAEQKSKDEAKARRAKRDEESSQRDTGNKRDFKPRSEGKRDRDDSRPPRKPYGSAGEKPSDKGGKKSAKPRFVGKDENGKPIFEGKTRERNHYIDGTPRTEAEKAYRTPYGSKPKFFGKEQSGSEKSDSAEGKKEAYRGDKKPYGDKKPFGEKKSYGEKKTFDEKKGFGDKKPYGDKKSYGEKKPFGEKKPYGDKKPNGDKKPFGDKKPYGEKKTSEAPAAPKRPPRRIDVKSFKPSDKKQ